jgi:hypothetical protein
LGSKISFTEISVKRFYQFLRTPLVMLAFFLAAFVLVLILEAVLGSDLVGVGGRLVYAVGSVLILLLYMRKRFQRDEMPRDLPDQAEKGSSRSSDDSQAQPSLEEVRERIRRKKLDAGKRE